ncbi:MAG: prephenate dehydrogenase/arogenate dehydrogenase family protein [Planctomycetales bacterium]|jgi:prephenate dehydrogenase|nr:prephenate dehydrogenase/arogenate dehydrogenase family protein [Planctomycetales bacterium]
MQTESHNFTEQSIVIVGVGLIGGSIAAAVRQRFPECHVIGIGRNQDRLKLATERGLLTEWSDQISAATIPDGSLAIVCLPVGQIAGAVRQLVDADCKLVTDAGSVKACVYEALDDASRGRFIGSHPIAGSEHTGFENADADLFVNRMCVVTPVNAATSNTERIVGFWKSIGSTVQQMSPDAHDRVLALTSHLPHIVAAVMSGCVAAELLPFTGTGFRDTTRIAAGSANLWTSILLGNATHCVASIDAAESLLQKFREAITTGNAATLESLLEMSAQRRRTL